nr:hypothetical protein Iba_chr02dCG11390 [Ipomoea batatas]
MLQSSGRNFTRPSLVTREFETFRDTNPVSPAFLNVTLESTNATTMFEGNNAPSRFCDRFSTVKDERCFKFLMPSSVNPPPQMSSDWRFLKSNGNIKNL